MRGRRVMELFFQNVLFPIEGTHTKHLRWRELETRWIQCLLFLKLYRKPANLSQPKTPQEFMRVMLSICFKMVSWFTTQVLLLYSFQVDIFWTIQTLYITLSRNLRPPTINLATACTSWEFLCPYKFPGKEATIVVTIQYDFCHAPNLSRLPIESISHQLGKEFPLSCEDIIAQTGLFAQIWINFCSFAVEHLRKFPIFRRRSDMPKLFPVCLVWWNCPFTIYFVAQA